MKNNLIQTSWSFILKIIGLKKISLVGFIQGLLKTLIIILMSQFMSGCQYYYKITTINHPQTEDISLLADTNRTFVIHTDSIVFIIDSVKIKNDSMYGNSIAEYQLPFGQNSYPSINSSNRYRMNKGDSRLLKEVHLYLQPGIFSEDTICSFALKDIYRLDIYNPDKKRTTLSWFTGCAIGCVSAPVTLFLVLAILSDLEVSCPYIYVNNGSEYVFTGEIYSGSIYAPLERHDYLVLPDLVEVDGKYLLMISNELQEIQHTNLAELIVIDHPMQSEVLIDKYGNYQTASTIHSPLTATNLLGSDILAEIKNRDSISYCGIPPTQEKEVPLTDNITLTFDLPGEMEHGKLFIRARNSLWLDYVYKKFHGLLGSYSETWTKKQNNSDTEDFTKWSLSQKIPLSIYVERNGEWVFCDYFNMAGPMAMKDDVITIDLKDIGTRPLKIKLESGTYFWEIDYVGIDYSENIPVKSTVVRIDKATNEVDKDIADLLRFDDEDYYIQSVMNETAKVSFQVPEFTNTDRTIFLHSKGFYQIIQETSGLPKIKKLKSIRKSGQFLEYSRELLKTEVDKIMKTETCDY
jgi:hypothetical protein